MPLSIVTVYEVGNEQNPEDLVTMAGQDVNIIGIQSEPLLDSSLRWNDMLEERLCSH
jgi:hypothetical protein